MAANTLDVIIIGGGVVGCFIARALSRYHMSVLLLERGADVCSGTSKANSAIVHAGYDAKPGSLKARLNAAGNRMYDQVCSELDVLFQRCGTYVVALTDEDLPTLDDLHRRGMQNGVPGMSLISSEEMRRAEPLINPQTRAALIAHDPRYGRIVCRCETVTEGEIAAAIHAPIQARTYDALKRRTRLGAGRCQGGFDTPRVLDILARELGIPATAVTKRGPGSEFVVRETKAA